MKKFSFDLDQMEQEIKTFQEMALDDGIHDTLKDICKDNSFSGNSYNGLDWADITVVWGSSSGDVQVCWHGIEVYRRHPHNIITCYKKGYWIELLSLLQSDQNRAKLLAAYETIQVEQKKVVETYLSMGSLT